MALEAIEHLEFDLSARSLVQEIGAVRIYCCSRGRMTWNDWVNYHFPESLHESLTSAKAFAERSRTQGSVFCIEQLPALLLATQHFSFIFTQINLPNPFSGYSLCALSEQKGWRQRKAFALNAVALKLGEKLRDAVESFDPSSNFWRSPPPLEDAVIKAKSTTPHENFEVLSGAPLLRWRSSSLGAYRELEWTQSTSGKTSLAILNLYREIKRS